MTRNRCARRGTLNSTVHHAFGYAYYVTGDKTFKQMGDEVFEASYGDQVDGLHCLADSGKAKDYDMNYRASGRHLVWRLAHQSGAQLSPESGSPRMTTVRLPTDRVEPRPVMHLTNAPTSTSLISSSLLAARQLSTDLANKEQIEGLINQIENALRSHRAFIIEKKQSALPDRVMEELQAALGHARTALSMAESGPGNV